VGDPGDYLYMDPVDRLVPVLVLDQVLLRLLDGDRGVGFRLLVVEVKMYFYGHFGYSNIHV
jgi:hypothetical protein